MNSAKYLLITITFTTLCSFTNAQTVDTLSVGQLAEILKSSHDFILIDGRDSAHYAQGHIEGALGMDVRRPSFETAIDTLDRDAKYILYCRTRIRIREMVEILHRKGFTNLTVMPEGYFVWEKIFREDADQTKTPK